MKYTPEDERLIGEAYASLIADCAKICTREGDRERIESAFIFAKDAHEGIRRRSGEPYILHPLAVAHIVVSEIGLGVKSVMAALLHDVVEDTDYTVEDMERLFGGKIAQMVDGLTKMAGVYQVDVSAQAENFRKMLLTLSDDVRVILIKIADRLHNMRTLGSMPPHKQMKITSETIYLFAPLAHRLGFYAIKSELENLTLKYRYPDEYHQIEEKLKESEQVRSRFIDQFNSPIAEKLRNSGIDFEISGRVKSIYSIWLKMQTKHIPFEEVYDLFAIRIVFKPAEGADEKVQCWQIYSLVTDIYTPKPDRIRDWVNIPKANGYEALHCTVMGPEGVWAEVQIRSQRMDEIAERGFAAHWKYKTAEERDEEGDLERWMSQIQEVLSGSSEDAVEFLDNFKLSLYSTDIVVFTPRGESRKLPAGATALDFAYEIHSSIGNQAIGAKINHKIESIFSPIRSGDQVEIITSQSASPKREWLDHVVTTRAKQRIKSYLKRNHLDNVSRGMEIFEARMQDFGIPPSARVFRKLLPAYECTNKDEFYSKLGSGIIHLDQVGRILRENPTRKILKYWTLQVPNPFRFLGGDDRKRAQRFKELNPDDTTAEEFVMAPCCNPIPGDEVVGYKNDDTHRIDVHKKSCVELINLASKHGNRLTPVSWASHMVMSYLSILEVRGIDRLGILMELSQVITGELNINIRELRIHSHDGIFEGHISLYVKDIEALRVVMDKVRRIRGIERVNRVDSIAQD